MQAVKHPDPEVNLLRNIRTTPITVFDSKIIRDFIYDSNKRLAPCGFHLRLTLCKISKLTLELIYPDDNPQ